MYNLLTRNLVKKKNHKLKKIISINIKNFLIVNRFNGFVKINRKVTRINIFKMYKPNNFYLR